MPRTLAEYTDVFRPLRTAFEGSKLNGQWMITCKLKTARGCIRLGKLGLLGKESWHSLIISSEWKECRVTKRRRLDEYYSTIGYTGGQKSLRVDMALRINNSIVDVYMTAF